MVTIESVNVFVDLTQAVEVTLLGVVLRIKVGTIIDIFVAGTYPGWFQDQRIPFLWEVNVSFVMFAIRPKLVFIVANSHLMC